MGYSNAKKIRGISLGKRLVMSIVVVISTATVILGLFGAMLTEGFMRQRFQDRMAFLARYLALNSELGILIGDHRMLQKLTQNLLSEKDVQGVEIRDTKGTVLVSVGRTREKELALSEAVSPVFLKQEEEDLAFERAGRPGPTRLGSVHIFYSEKGIEAVVASFRHKTMVAALILITISSLVTAYIARRLTAPLKALASAARKVAKGELKTRVHGGTLPETREVANAFNNMLTAIEEQRRTLEETYQEMIQQKALAEVGQFAFTVAHEIKNPLGIIHGSLEILKKEEAGPDVKATMISYVEDEVKRLNRIIQDFLEFARPRSPELRETAIVNLLKDVVEKVKVEWEPRGTAFDIHVPDMEVFGRADPDLLSQAFLNLLKNACEATEDEAHPRVWVRAQDIGETLRVAIEDNGPGIPEEERHKVFEPFFTTKAKGTGLGLSFVKRIIELHGGTISITDSYPKGTCMEMEFPLTRRQ